MKVRLLCTIVLLALLPFAAEAHDLLPQEVRTYIEENPDATAEDIRSFAELNELPVSGAGSVLSVASEKRSFLKNTIAFVRLGIEHILSGPDHVLFIVAMTLSVMEFSAVLRMSVAFTVAHSITFILAGTSLLTLSSLFVEPIIALSIAVVAGLGLVQKRFENVPSRKIGWVSIATVFMFGLFHGLGFAGLLRDIRVPEESFLWSLVSFNIGIELGQLLVLAVALPVLMLARRSPWAKEAHIVLAVAIIFIGCVWTIERLRLL